MTVRTEKKADGRIKVKIIKTFRKEDGKNTSAIVKDLGYLDDLEKEHENPLAWAKEEAKRLTEENKEARKKRIQSIDFDTTPLDQREGGHGGPVINIGSAAISRIYHDLEIDEFLDNRRRYRRFGFNVEKVVRFLIYNRVLDPDSKKGAWEKKHLYYDSDDDFSLDQVYETMDFLASYKEDLVKKIDTVIGQKYSRNTCHLFYDVTNYYFEIDNNDEEILDEEGNPQNKAYRQPGCSKEHRTTPIVQMGLFMDQNGIPVDYDLFRGNTHDSQTLVPMISKASTRFEKTGLIVVADKGMMSGDNIKAIRERRQGYVISSSVRKSDAKFQEWVLDDEGYSEFYNANSGILEYRIKSRFSPRFITVHDPENKKRTKKVRINERQIVIWSRKYAERARKQRDEVLEKTIKLIGRRSGEATTVKFGARKYIVKSPIKGGMPADVDDYVISLDENLVNEEEALDGYYAICTNVTGVDGDRKAAEFFKNHPDRTAYYDNSGFFVMNREEVPPQEIVDIYHGLWRIEETFKVTKSTLQTRPVFHWTEKRIEGHFLICFISLTILRLLQYRLNWKYSSKVITEVLKDAVGIGTGLGEYVFRYYDPVLGEIGKLLGIDFTKVRRTKNDIRMLFAGTKK